MNVPQQVLARLHDSWEDANRQVKADHEVNDTSIAQTLRLIHAAQEQNAACDRLLSAHRAIEGTKSEADQIAALLAIGSQPIYEIVAAVLSESRSDVDSSSGEAASPP